MWFSKSVIGQEWNKRYGMEVNEIAKRRRESKLIEELSEK